MISNAKQINNIINSIKKKMVRINNQIKSDYTDGKLDLSFDVDDEHIDLSEKLMKLLILSNGVADLLTAKGNKLESAKIDNIYENITKSIENIHRLYNNDASDISHFDFFPADAIIMAINSVGSDIEHVIEVASIEMLYYGYMQLKSPDRLTKSIMFNSLIWFYILIKNGYIDKLVEEKIIELDTISIDKINKNSTFNEFCDWIDTFGVNSHILKTYLKTYYSSNSCNERVQEFLIELNEEMKIANENNENSKLVLEKRQANSDREDMKILASRGIQLADILVYFEVTEEEERVYNGIVGLIHSVFKLHTDNTAKYIENTCGNLKDAIEIGLKLFLTKIEMDEENIDESDSLIIKQKGEIEKCKSLIKTYKSKAKQAERELAEVKTRLSTQKSKNEKQIAYIENLKNQGITNVKPYKDEIESLKTTLSSKEEEILALKRAQSRINQAYNELKEAYNRKLDSCIDLEKQLKDLNEKLSSALISSQGNSIPLECYIRAIRNKKIALFGGNMMHSELKNLGFRNLKLFEASNRNMSFNDLAHQDLIVVVTGYMSHSTMQIPKGASEKYNIPIHYFNNKNIQMLIQEMFAIFYSDKYKAFKESKKDIGI